MLYQVLHMGYYVIKRLKVHSFMRSAKQLLVDVVTIVVILFATSVISEAEPTWMGWILLAVEHAVIIGGCIAAANLVFYKKETMQIVRKVIKKKH